MARSPLFGRRIHIAGSIVEDMAVAAAGDVEQARELIPALVKELVRRGANFVIPVDAEPVRKSDGLPICFDWLVWKTIKVRGDICGTARVSRSIFRRYPPEGLVAVICPAFECGP